MENIITTIMGSQVLKTDIGTGWKVLSPCTMPKSLIAVTTSHKKLLQASSLQ
jgi:hypothetical protein